MSEFKREERYVVIKIKDLVEASGDTDPATGKSEAECVLRNFLDGWHVPTRDCVVVERDWPEYHLVWAMIEHRMAGKPVPNFNDWRRADELQQRLTAADERIDELTKPQGQQLAHMPIERCYDVRTQMIIAFNAAKINGGDLDDALDAAYKSALRFSLNPLTAEQPDRSPESYAIEHAEYMAKSADDVMAKFQAYGLALLAVDEGGDDGEGELFEAIDTARGDLQESLVDLRGMVYEFRKRSAKSQ